MDVVLRKLKKKDAPQLAKLANNKKIADNLRDLFPHPYTIKDAEWFVDFVHTESPYQRWAIECDGHLCGVIGLHKKEDVYRRNLELGYWLGEEYWGKGIGTVAVQKAIDIGFGDEHCHRIYASVFAFNAASYKVLLKNGFVEEGTLRQSIYKNGEFHNEIRLGLLKSEYFRNK